MSYSDIIRESADGKYRAVLTRDDCPEEPYDEGEVPILRIESFRYVGGYYAESVNPQAEKYAHAFNVLSDLGGYATQVFERYLRIFHGTKGVRIFSNQQATDYTYVAFDTAEWREKVGAETKYLEPGTYMSEYVDYLEGEVFHLDVQELTDGACGHTDCDEHQSWESVDSIGGLYGDNDYTNSGVLEYHFAEYFPTETVAA